MKSIGLPQFGTITDSRPISILMLSMTVGCRLGTFAWSRSFSVIPAKGQIARNAASHWILLLYHPAEREVSLREWLVLVMYADSRIPSSYFQQHFSHNGDTAYVDRRGLRTVRWSYQQIGELAAGWAALLAERNVVKGDRVLLWAENSAHWVAAFYGCLLRGAIVVPLDAGSDRGFAARVQQQVEAKVLLADSSRGATERVRWSSGSIARYSSATSRTAKSTPVEQSRTERSCRDHFYFRNHCRTSGRLPDAS